MDDPNTLAPNRFYQKAGGNDISQIFQTDDQGVPINIETNEPGLPHTNYRLIPHPEEYARLSVESGERELRIGRLIQDRLAKKVQASTQSQTPLPVRPLSRKAGSVDPYD